MLSLVAIPYRPVVADGYDPSKAPADQASFTLNNDNSVDTFGTAPKKQGNAFVRALTSPFRAIGRLFGGGKKNDQQARRTSNKDAGKFEANNMTRIKDATTPLVVPDSNAPAGTQSSAADFERHLSKARELLKAGDFNNAIVELTTATSINQRSAEANNLLGISYETKGWRDSALKSFETAVTLAENNAEYLNNLGYLLYKSNDYERATKFLKRAAKTAKNNARIWNNLGLAYCERGKFDDAYKSFVEAGGEYSGRLNIAAQLQQRGYAKDAIKHLEKAQALKPNSSEVLNKLVALYDMTGRQTDAENARRTIVALKTFADANK
jgi:Flp pilus assembly protein TadD